MIVSSFKQPQQQQKPWSALQKAATDLGPAQDGRLHIDGVRWDIENNPDGSTIEKGVFRDAYINPDKVTDVHLCIKPFTENTGGVPGHALLKFDFAPDSPVVDSQGNTDPSLAVSMEVHFKQGQGYDPGASDQPIIYQLGTWTDAIEKATLHDHNPLKIYKLKLNHEQQVSLLKERLQESVQNHDNVLYDAVENNCLTTLIDGVNKVTPPEQQIPKKDSDGDPIPQSTVPVWSPQIFRQYQLLAPGAPVTIPAKPKPTSEG